VTSAHRLQAEAQSAITAYAQDARQHGARLLSYTDFAVTLGKPPNYARRMGPLLAALRPACLARGLPDICAVIVAAGTDMPSPKSFDTLSGTWCDTGMDADGVRAEQARVLGWNWDQV
jgi:hypothetical protein